MNQKGYSSSYSEERFWNKITRVPGTAGCSVLRSAVTLYILLVEPDVPIWAKASIIGALGYFICPIDTVQILYLE